VTRLFAVLIALASLTVGFTAPANAASAKSCAHRTAITGYHGTHRYPPYTVQQNVWTKQGKQTMSVCSASNWTATVNQKGAPETGVKTYPDSSKAYSDWMHCSSQPAVRSFTTLRSTFAERGPKAASWNFAYDIFLNGGACKGSATEVMVWNQWHQVSVPRAQFHATIDGVAYDVYHSGRYIQVRRAHQTESGSVNLLAVLRALEQRRLIRSADTLQFVQYGVEVLTTYGRNQPFQLRGFAIQDHRK
jgi:hypothetical protein